ncbi:MFS transporter [Gordonia liuliyuniae]|uniref:MFS transporter n=1 Tax=Gordonia liuliyuniae TaxID=2911517 RepID=A0ABS9IQ82_9ACTN|nr:MFS transporter [Gordonia liuliyuniae]MCF8587720.1 MFS transporter [Gordonia liuliyuniae]
MTDSSGTVVPPRIDAEPGWTPRLALSLLSLVLVLELLSVSYMMVSMAVLPISAEYQTAQGAWMITAFLLVGAVLSPLLGKLADIIGKRKVILVCIVVSAIGSVISAVAISYAVMIFGRALSGVLVPTLFLSYSLIRDVFPAKTVPLAVSICTAGCGLITVAAPFLTGWLIDSFGWRSLFWFFTAVLAVCLAMIMCTTPETPIRLHASLDVLGSVLIGAGLAGVLVAVSFGPEWGWAAPSTLSFLVVGVILTAAWYQSASRVTDPLIRLDVLRRPSIAWTVTAAGSIYGLGAVFSVILPIMAMTPQTLGLGYGWGLTAEGYAIFQVPLGGMTMLGGIVVGTTCGRGMHPRILLMIAMTLSGVGGIATALFHDNKALLFVLAGVVGAGMGMGYAAIPNMLIKAAPPELQASTASVAGVVQSLSSAVLPVVAFAIMNNSFMADLPAEQTGGAVVYTDGGYVAAFFLVAATAVVGLVAAVALPKITHQFQAEQSPVGSAVAGTH